MVLIAFDSLFGWRADALHRTVGERAERGTWDQIRDGLIQTSAVGNVSSLKHNEKHPFYEELRVEKGYPGKKDHTVFVTRGVFVPGNMTNTEGIQRPIQQVVFCLLMKIKNLLSLDY